MNGITGTAMPYFKRELESEKIWDVGNYVAVTFIGQTDADTEPRGIDASYEPPGEGTMTWELPNRVHSPSRFWCKGVQGDGQGLSNLSFYRGEITMYYSGWIMLVSISLWVSLLAFVWALRTGQFAFQQGRARYLPLAGEYLPAPPGSRGNKRAIESYALLAVAAIGLVGILSAIMVSLVQG